MDTALVGLGYFDTPPARMQQDFANLGNMAREHGGETAQRVDIFVDLGKPRVDRLADVDQLGARIAIYRMMRPGEPPTEDAVETLFRRLFFDDETYDLSRVGRMKVNSRFGRADITGPMVLTHEDIIDEHPDVIIAGELEGHVIIIVRQAALGLHESRGH